MFVSNSASHWIFLSLLSVNLLLPLQKCGVLTLLERDTALCMTEIHRVKLKTWRRGTNKRPETGIPGMAPGQRWPCSWQLPSATRKLQNILMSSAAWQWQPPSDWLVGWAAYHHHFPAVHLPLRTRNSHWRWVINNRCQRQDTNKSTIRVRGKTLIRSMINSQCQR